MPQIHTLFTCQWRISLALKCITSHLIHPNRATDWNRNLDSWGFSRRLVQLWPPGPSYPELSCVLHLHALPRGWTQLSHQPSYTWALSVFCGQLPNGSQTLMWWCISYNPSIWEAEAEVSHIQVYPEKPSDLVRSCSQENIPKKVGGGWGSSSVQKFGVQCSVQMCVRVSWNWGNCKSLGAGLCIPNAGRVTSLPEAGDWDSWHSCFQTEAVFPGGRLPGLFLLYLPFFFKT